MNRYDKKIEKTKTDKNSFIVITPGKDGVPTHSKSFENWGDAQRYCLSQVMESKQMCRVFVAVEDIGIAGKETALDTLFFRHYPITDVEDFAPSQESRQASIDSISKVVEVYMERLKIVDNIDGLLREPEPSDRLH